MRQSLYPKAKYPLGHTDVAVSLNNLGGLAMARQQYVEAEPYCRDALAMFQALYPSAKYPQGHVYVARCLNNLAGAIDNQGNNARAEPLYREAVAMQQALFPRTRYPQGHPEVAVCLNNLGGVLDRQGKYAEAEQCMRYALAMRRAFYPPERYPQGHPFLATTINNLGAVLRGQSAYARAEPLEREALAMHLRLAKHFAELAPEPAALNAAATFPLSRDGLLSTTRHLAGSDARTYEAIWHSRAALTRVYQCRHLALVAAATDPAIRATWDQLQTLRRQREQLIMAPVPPNKRERDQRLSRLGQQIDTADGTLLPELPVLKYYQDLDRLGPEALQKRLPVDAVLVDLLRYTDFEQDVRTPGAKGETRTLRYLAFAVSGTGVTRVELGTAAAIDAVVRQWRDAITAPLPPGNDTARQEEARRAGHAARLRRLIWEPIEPHLPKGTATVYLAPDAELTQLPWAALPGKDKGRVLLEDYALAVLPHGPFLLEQLAPPPPRCARRPPAPEGLLLVGGIRYDDRPSATVVASRAAKGVVEQPVVWQGLKGAESERQLLAKLLPSGGPRLTANLSGTEATTARLRQELAQCRYAHIATHGFFADAKFRSILQLDEALFRRWDTAAGNNPIERRGEGARSPLVLSGLVCSGANLRDTPERGILSGDAIAGLLLDDLHLAVLSACDTGIGDVAGGEGVFGLQRAFHIAGCKNVVASLWKVDDAATAALMTRFYGHLFADKLPPIEALRRAQLELYRHPELIGAWARGEQRGPGKARPATTPPPPDTPRDWVTSEGRAPIRLWAAFLLSGAGR
jgi:CHAT domain-containing protein/tetratricopeptide (TPR) repeat protein